MPGTVTFVHHTVGEVKKIVATCTADAGDASYPATALPAIDGFLLGLETNPDGGTAPTDLYDITLPDGDGVDRLQGVGANRATATSEYAAVVLSGTEIHPPASRGDTLTLTLVNNSVNSAVTVVTLYYVGG